MNNDQSIKLSVCLVVHNEERLIRRCLESVKSIADEIILVHDGPCLDNTLIIAKEYGAKIIEAPFFGVMESILHLAYQATRGLWVLRIDADEFLSAQAQEDIIALLDYSEIDAYEFIWPFYDGTRYRTKTWPYKRCLFKKTSISYLGLIHAVAEVKGNIKRVPIILDHQPDYNNYSFSVFKKKWLKWAYLQAEQVLSDFSAIPKFNYSDLGWSTTTRLRNDHPLVFMSLDFFVVLIKMFWSGAWKEGLYAWKVSFMIATYRLMVDYYIFRIKKNKCELINKKAPVCPCGKRDYLVNCYSLSHGLVYVAVCKSCKLGRTMPIPLQSIEVVDYYDNRDDYQERWESRDLRARFSQRTIKCFKKYKKTGRLLDIGCNMGIFVYEAEKAGFLAQGIDPSLKAINFGIEKLGLGDRLQQGTLKEKEISSASVDVITYIHCLEHIEPICDELKEAHRVLDNEGLLVIEIPNYFSLWRCLLRGYWYPFSPFEHIWQGGYEGFKNLLARESFLVVKVYKRFNMYHKFSFSLSGLMKALIAFFASLTGTADNLLIIAKKKK